MILPENNNPYNQIIVGFGTVGKVTAMSLSSPCYVDKDVGNIPKEKLISAEVYIFCLPTPTIKGKQDISLIIEWLDWIKANWISNVCDVINLKLKPLVIIRSTILPGTTKKLQKKYPNIEIVHVPEFLTMSTAVNDAEYPEFLVIGSDNLIIRSQIRSIFRVINPKRIIECSPTTAELIKYTMNSFFALKVIFGNQIWDVAKKSGANYKQVVKALEEHKWGSKNGWDVWYDTFRGYGGLCLPKDTEALMNKFNLPLLKTMKQINDKLIKETT